ncbi:MAG: AsmA-like C-terminal region-containing protein [Planctomycetota bacterium]|nr:AsmA-like C-terminal region-containing protein [Planctomycetota bacterium]
MKDTAEDLETRALRRSLRARRPLMVAARGLVYLAGWACFLGIFMGLLAENHPALERWVAQAVQDRIAGALTRSVRVQDVDVRWFDRSVAFRDIAMGPTGRELQLDELTFRIGWTPARGLHLDRVVLNGGSLELSESLAVDMENVGERDQTTLDLLANSPEVVVRGLRVRVVPPGSNTIALGSVDLCMTRLTDELASIYGRLVPALGAAPGSTGVVWLNGTLDANKVARVRGVARGLRVDSSLQHQAVSNGLLPPQLVALDPSANIDLVAHASFEIGRSLLPDVNGSLHLSKGSLKLPWIEDPDKQTVTELDMRLEGRFNPANPDHPFDPEAWRGRGNLAGRLGDLEATAEFRLGKEAPDGTSLEVWADVPDAPLGAELLEIVGGEPSIADIDAMLASHGNADVTLGVRLREDVGPDRELPESLEKFALVRPRGGAALAYHGVVDRWTRQQGAGFPVPVQGVSGDITWSDRTEGQFPGQLAFYDVTCFQAGGPLAVQGSLHFAPRRSATEALPEDEVPAPFHLIVQSNALPVDQTFREAFGALRGVDAAKEIVPEWSPAGGALDFKLELWRGSESLDMITAIDASLRGVGFTWKDLPVPVTDTAGTLRIRSHTAGQRTSVQLNAEARSPIASDPVLVTGRTMTSGANRGLEWFDVSLGGLNPNHEALRASLTESDPGALEALDGAGLAGSVDVGVTVTRAIPLGDAARLREADVTESDFLGGAEAWLEFRPTDPRSGVQFRPTAPGITTRETHGSVRAWALFPPEAGATATAAREPLTWVLGRAQGSWRQDGPRVPVVATLEATPGDAPTLRAFGAGLDLANEELVSALSSLALPGAASESAFTGEQLELQGRADFETRLRLPEEPGAPLQDLEVSVETRLDRLGFGEDKRLREVSAHFRLEPETGQWVGEEINGRLAGTPIQLSEFSWSPGEDRSTFRTRVSARDLPIDAEHLRFFLDPSTVRTFLEDLEARGRFALEDTTLQITSEAAGSTEVLLEGDISVEEVFVMLGVPIEVDNLDRMRLELAHKGSGLRSRATIEGLNGALADRRLQDATLQLSYVEPRLVIEAFEGDFEGGRLVAVGSDEALGAPLLVIDLEPPFPFKLAAELRDVDLGQFLRGMFDSDFANRGRMDMTLRLDGDFERLTALTGGGEIELRDSALWAIPVFQALSVGLGIDTTVLFREMYARYSIADGVLTMDRLRVNSDLLSLVGDGAVSFEGNVTSNLDVRYALVDRLGPFTQLLYWIQESLLRVAVRGTVERPVVVLRGLASSFFTPDEERDRLPLPGFSRRPKRF